MDAVGQYLISLLTVSAAAGIIGLLAPEGQNDGIKKFLKYIVSLAAAAVLLAPVGAVVKALPSLIASFDENVKTQNEEITLSPELYSEMAESSAKAIGDALEERIKKEYNVSCEITLSLDTSDYSSVKITGAKYKIKNADTLYSLQIKKLLSDTLLCGGDAIEQEIVP